MTYYDTQHTDDDFETVVQRVTEALQDEEFGILCEIDVQEKFEEKLGLESYPRYRILGACNPPLARDAIDAEPDLGVLLPCNMIVYETDDQEVVVSAVDPGELLSVVDNPALDSIARDVQKRFDRVFETLSAEGR
jgi:uncharacterized protein (DUF302 family)